MALALVSIYPLLDIGFSARWNEPRRQRSGYVRLTDGKGPLVRSPLLKTFGLGLFLLFVVALPSFGAMDDRTAAVKQRATAMYGKLPLSFERNEGQADARVRFLARGRGYGLFLTRREAVLSLAGRAKEKPAVLRVGLTHGGAGGADPVGVDALEGKMNYFTGKDPNQWHTGVNSFAAVKYTGVYPGIDLIYHGNQGQLEYDFDVAPGADPRRIDLRFRGARQLRINSAGDLVVSLGESELVEHRPVVYQRSEGKRELVAGSYVLRGRDRVGFRLGRYDRSRAVVIDPELVYSTYLGGTRGDAADSIAVDAAGNTFVAGFTESIDFPVTSDAFQTSGLGAFVTKLNATGSALLYSTYLGNSASCTAIAIDKGGNAFVTGSAGADFPVTPGAFQTSGSGAFITKLNATGSALIYSTILGGSGVVALARGIAIDGAGNAYVTGDTGSGNFPVTPGAFQTSSPGYVGGAFVTKVNATGSALIYSTCLGGSGVYGDVGYGIATDSDGNSYITGFAQSEDFPVTPGAFQTKFGGAGECCPFGDAFVTKLNAAGSALVYSTYLGGSGSDQGYGIVIDAAGNAYVTGETRSGNFPVTASAFQKHSGSAANFLNAFVTKLNATGSALVYSTYLGGSRTYLGDGGDDGGRSISIDAAGNAYVTGFTGSENFPITPGAFQIRPVDVYNAFVTKLNAAGSALLYSTYLGGGGEAGYGIVADTGGNAYITGDTDSKNFPVTPGAFQTSLGDLGATKAFVSKLDTTQFGPVISLAGVVPGPPKQIQIRSQDQRSGLATVQILECNNCTAVTDSFTPGTKDPVLTTATKTYPSYSSAVQIEATNLAGNTTVYDPTDITIQADGHAEIQLVRISGLEHVVLITNGSPGVRAIDLRVRRKDIPVLSLKDGETRIVDIAAELMSGRNNEVTLLSWGPRGASASVVFTQP